MLYLYYIVNREVRSVARSKDIPHIFWKVFILLVKKNVSRTKEFNPYVVGALQKFTSHDTHSWITLMLVIRGHRTRDISRSVFFSVDLND